MEIYSIKFDGKILNRGFWLYVIDIRSPVGRYLYVGRTGDSSSANAASPFNRIGNHLNFRPNAKGNALTRNLRQIDVDPSQCTFEMIAIGPVFPEASDFASHRPLRDQVAALEKGLATALRRRGYNVIGNHLSSISADPQKLEKILAIIKDKLPATKNAD